MIINRIKDSVYGVVLAGKTIAEIQDMHFKCNDVASEEAARSDDDVTCLIYDELPLLTESVLRRLFYRCKSCKCGFDLGRGYIKSTEYSGKNFFFKSESLRVFHPYNYSFFAERINREIVLKHRKQGVFFSDENSVKIDYDAVIERYAFIRPYVSIEGKSVIRERAVINSFSRIIDSEVGESATITHSTVENSRIGDKTTVGPYAYIRQNTAIGVGCRIGDFVEIKNSELGDRVKAAHLAYIGDASVGDKTNVGCGTVFCNYDGKTKHRSNVGSNVFIGANTNLVAPITVGDNAFIAAGGTVTENVPADSFVIGRSKQTVKKPRK